MCLSLYVCITRIEYKLRFYKCNKDDPDLIHLKTLANISYKIFVSLLLYNYFRLSTFLCLIQVFLYTMLSHGDVEYKEKWVLTKVGRKGVVMGLLLIILILLLLGGLPTWGYSRDWGYRPSGILGVLLIVLIVLLLLGYIPRGF